MLENFTQAIDVTKRLVDLNLSCFEMIRLFTILHININRLSSACRLYINVCHNETIKKVTTKAL